MPLANPFISFDPSVNFLDTSKEKLGFAYSLHYFPILSELVLPFLGLFFILIRPAYFRLLCFPFSRSLKTKAGSFLISFNKGIYRNKFPSGPPSTEFYKFYCSSFLIHLTVFSNFLVWFFYHWLFRYIFSNFDFLWIYQIHTVRFLFCVPL